MPAREEDDLGQDHSSQPKSERDDLRDDQGNLQDRGLPLLELGHHDREAPRPLMAPATAFTMKTAVAGRSTSVPSFSSGT